MRLKPYFAATVGAAMNLARLEPGDDAMPVSTKRTSEESYRLGEYEVVFATTAYPDARAIVPSPQHQAAAQITPAQAWPRDKLSEEAASLKHEMEKLAAALARSAAGIAKIAANRNLAEAFSQLVGAELDATTAPVRSRLIAAELSRLLNVDNRVPSTPEKNAIALAGPPGSGKTTTLFKLAIRCGLGTRGRSHILTLGSHRVAASKPLRSYAAITGLGFQTLETRRSLAQALQEHGTRDLIFIDTPNLAPGDLLDGAELAKMVSRHPRIEVHLVLSASMKPADMKRIAQQYEMFAPAKLIFTRLDETDTFGPLVNLSLDPGKPIAFFSRGPQIPEDPEPAGRPTIADLVLKETRRGRDEMTSAAVA